MRNKKLRMIQNSSKMWNYKNTNGGYDLVMRNKIMQILDQIRIL